MTPSRIEEIVSGLVRDDGDRIAIGTPTTCAYTPPMEPGAVRMHMNIIRTAIREALLSALREEREAVIAKCADEANAAAEALNSEKDDYVGACGAGYAAHRIRSLKDNPHGDPR